MFKYTDLIENYDKIRTAYVKDIQNNNINKYIIVLFHVVFASPLDTYTDRKADLSEDVTVECERTRSGWKLGYIERKSNEDLVNMKQESVLREKRENLD